MKDFRTRALAFISRVPKGRVVSYGQVAAACSQPRAARQVGGILRGLPADSGIPWWRVINSQGVISIKGNWVAGKEQQRAFLLKEGVKVSAEFKIDLKRYRYGGTE